MPDDALEGLLRNQPVEQRTKINGSLFVHRHAVLNTQCLKATAPVQRNFQLSLSYRPLEVVSTGRGRNDSRRSNTRDAHQEVDGSLSHGPTRRRAAACVPVPGQSAQTDYFLNGRCPPCLDTRERDVPIHCNAAPHRNVRMRRRLNLVRRNSGCRHCFPHTSCIVSVVKSAKPFTTHLRPKSSHAKTSSGFGDFGAPRAVRVIWSTSFPSRERRTGVTPT